MSRKGENIYKRKDGRWEGRYLKHCPDGPRYGYVYARSYREVKQRLRDASAQWAARPAAAEDSMLLRDVAARWEQSLRHRVKDSTLVKYQGILRNHLLPHLGDLFLRELTHRRMEEFSVELLRHGGKDGEALAPRTVSDVLSVLRSILRFAAQDGAYVPCDGSSVRVSCPAAETRVLTLAEQKMLSAYIYNNITPANIGILLSLYTGLRVGEVCGLRWEDIDLDEGVLHVRRTVQRLRNLDGDAPRTHIVVTEPKSASALRTIPLPREVTAILTAIPAAHSGWLLTEQEQPMEPRCLQHRFKHVLKELGLPPANYHALRHTFATRCVELGFDVKALSELLGHSTVSMTMDRYVHPTLEHKRKCMGLLIELLPEPQRTVQ